ncbi:hypothetical protein [Halomonas organivorans]|uniref:Uncharacterized protein n=1 Tax=Halomonas organivorans TaxID=257772 RepID=A0A7W5G727_9GAMM|nr:hypothetical protein [Halomonas organivorans]MBB3142805.1 hypothetical protein [Halomonas organivorans]
MTAEMKGGRLAREAAMLGGLPVFGRYLDARRRRQHGMTEAQLPDGTHTPEDAADAIRQACGVVSRAELDHDEEAAAMFRRIVADFGNWKRRREGAC